MFEFVWRGTEEGCRWHRAGTGLAHCPLAVPGSICHQQEHLQAKVPLSPSVRVTSLAFPLVQGLRPPVHPSSSQIHGILDVSECVFRYRTARGKACVLMCVSGEGKPKQHGSTER